MNKNNLKEGDWVKINVDKFMCVADEEFNSFYRDKVAKIHKLRGLNKGTAVLDMPSFFSDNPYACLGTYCLELVKQPNKQLTFVFTD